MIIGNANDEYETIIKRHVCDFHKKHPGESYAGCTCSCSYERRKVKDGLEKEEEFEQNYYDRKQTN